MLISKSSKNLELVNSNDNFQLNNIAVEENKLEVQNIKKKVIDNSYKKINSTNQISQVNMLSQLNMNEESKLSNSKVIAKNEDNEEKEGKEVSPTNAFRSLRTFNDGNVISEKDYTSNILNEDSYSLFDQVLNSVQEKSKSKQ